MEVIDWIKENSKNSFLGHYIIEAMSKVGNGQLTEFGNFNAQELQVEMKINGIEVPFQFFFKLVEDHFNNYEKELEETQAEKVVARKLDELNKKFKEVFGIDPWETY